MPCRTSCRGAALAERKGAESWFYRLQHWDCSSWKIMRVSVEWVPGDCSYHKLSRGNRRAPHRLVL